MSPEKWSVSSPGNHGFDDWHTTQVQLPPCLHTHTHTHARTHTHTHTHTLAHIRHAYTKKQKQNTVPVAPRIPVGWRHPVFWRGAPFFLRMHSDDCVCACACGCACVRARMWEDYEGGRRERRITSTRNHIFCDPCS